MIVYKIINGLRQIITTPVNKVLMRMHRVRYGTNFHSKGVLTLRNYSGENGISIGDNVNINSSLSADPVWHSYETVLFTKKNGHIRIGSNVGISNACLCSESLIEIRDHVTIGAGVKIYDTDFHPLDAYARRNGNVGVITKPVIISDSVFIGAGALILKGVTIGENSIIGAGAVVTKSIPANEIWAGNPAHYIKTVD